MVMLSKLDNMPMRNHKEPPTTLTGPYLTLTLGLLKWLTMYTTRPEQRSISQRLAVADQVERPKKSRITSSRMVKRRITQVKPPLVRRMNCKHQASDFMLREVMSSSMFPSTHAF